MIDQARSPRSLGRRRRSVLDVILSPPLPVQSVVYIELAREGERRGDP
jgi:hypothetical protein